MLMETERMIIRKFLPEDAQALHAIFGDEETMTNVEPAYSPEKTKDFLNTFCIGRNGALAAARKSDSRLIGYILFKEYEEEVYEIGWIFRRDCWRQGYAFEACSRVIDYAFEALNAHKIFAEAIDPIKSVDLMKKLGLKAEGVQRSQTKDPHGNWTDLYFYGLLKKEWTQEE